MTGGSTIQTAGICGALMILLSAGPVFAQAPAAAGTVEGHDVTVDHPAITNAATAANGTPIGDGSTIVVHSGKARVQLARGGTVSVCGPAKFTVLDSNGALTLALEFGQVHVSLPEPAPLQVFTPFYTGFPQSMGDGPLDFTLGLETNGAFCARATHGGLQLEQQLTGQSLTVPQPEEIFLQGGNLTPQRIPAAHCACEVTPADVAGAKPRVAAPATTERSEKPMSEDPTAPIPAAADNYAEPTTEPEAAVPATSPAREIHPKAGATQQTAKDNAALPPLRFDYRVPFELPEPDAATLVLVKEVRVEPDWMFSGQVKSPHKSAGKGSGQSAAAEASHESFWSKLKHFFLGGRKTKSQAQAAPAQAYIPS